MGATSFNPEQFRVDTYDIGSLDAALKMLRVCLQLLGVPTTLNNKDLLKAIKSAEEEHERSTS